MPPDVSREAQEKLEVYHALLLKWQKAINLVSNQAIENARERHFNDSIQLADFLPKENLSSLRKQGSAASKEDSRFRGKGKLVLMDMGSGAGFPGLVLSILRSELDVHLVESDGKKCEFLRTVSRETDTPVTIHNQRIEDMAGKIRPDVMTARALASLEALCEYNLPFAEENPELVLLFLKGEKAQEEIERAQQKFSFDLAQFPSETDPKGMILRISSLHRICE